MADNYEHDKPYSLTATYLVEPALSALTSPYDLHAIYDPDYVVNTIDFKIDDGFSFEVTVIYADSGANTAVIDTVLDTEFKTEIEALFDINFIRGVEAYWIEKFQRAIPCLTSPNISWAKPIFKAHNSAFYFERSLS